MESLLSGAVVWDNSGSVRQKLLNWSALWSKQQPFLEYFIQFDLISTFIQAGNYNNSNISFIHSTQIRKMPCIQTPRCIFGYYWVIWWNCLKVLGFLCPASIQFLYDSTLHSFYSFAIWKVLLILIQYCLNRVRTTWINLDKPFDKILDSGQFENGCLEYLSCSWR